MCVTICGHGVISVCNTCVLVTLPSKGPRHKSKIKNVLLGDRIYTDKGISVSDISYMV